jgi:hypothetical protein
VNFYPRRIFRTDAGISEVRSQLLLGEAWPRQSCLEDELEVMMTAPDARGGAATSPDAADRVALITEVGGLSLRKFLDPMPWPGSSTIHQSAAESTSPDRPEASASWLILNRRTSPRRSLSVSSRAAEPATARMSIEYRRRS